MWGRLKNPEQADVNVKVSKSSAGILISLGPNDRLLVGKESENFETMHVNGRQIKELNEGRIIEVKIPSFVAKRYELI